MSDGGGKRRGPLHGLRVLELGGVGPGPHAAMWLGDLGADVVTVVRPQAIDSAEMTDRMLERNKARVAADLKSSSDVERLLHLAETADVVIEGFRPGVVEGLGLGPDVLLMRNPRLVYGRVTGWGRSGPQRHQAGHDINYLAVSGLLHAIGPADGGPVPPLNLVADFGGGSMVLLVGILSALAERERSGLGQVVDSSMLTGALGLSHMVWEMKAYGQWRPDRGSNALDGGAPFYGTYRCFDGRYIAVGAMEPQFYARFVGGLGLETDDLPHQLDRSRWPELRVRFAEEFGKRTRDEWVERFAGLDACVSPVLTMDEAVEDPQLAAMQAFCDVDGDVQPRGWPIFSRSAVETPLASRTVPLGEAWTT